MFNVICIVHTTGRVAWNYHGENIGKLYQYHMSQRQKQAIVFRWYSFNGSIYTNSLVLL
jgi:hypothetical protein